ncbi:regulator of chromosome condensation [Vibrio phage 1.209.O._10N.222.52.B2]|nr:regulator of chromosome condensation [Vibrio phage 1.209.O._10N.222.52.B2]
MSIQINNWSVAPGSYDDATLTELVGDTATLATIMVVNNTGNAGTFDIALRGFYEEDAEIYLYQNEAIDANEKKIIDVRSINIIAPQVLVVSASASADIGFFASGVLDDAPKQQPKFEAVRVFGGNESDRVYILGADGKLYAGGSNYDGELSNPDTLYNEQPFYAEMVDAPTIATTPPLLGVVNMDADYDSGFGTCYFIDGSSTDKYAVGKNYYFQLDIDASPEEGVSTFTLCDTPADHVAAAEDFQVWIHDGTLYGTGYGGYYNFGNNSTDDLETATDLAFPATPIAVACGLYHTIVLDDEGRVWGAGDNSSGQLGQADTVAELLVWTVIYDETSRPPTGVFCAPEGSVLVGNSDFSGAIIVSGDNQDAQLGSDDVQNLFGWELTGYNWDRFGIRKVACGYYHIIVLATDGSAKTAGTNYDFSMGSDWSDGEVRAGMYASDYDYFSTNIQDVALTDGCSFFIVDGLLYGIGGNYYGELGIPTYPEFAVETQLPPPGYFD